MKRISSIAALVTIFAFHCAASAQQAPYAATIAAVARVEFDPSVASLGQISPEAALEGMVKRSAQQAQKLAAYQSETVITADLLDTSQHGEFELIRKYTAEPKSLSYSSVRYEGDRFVKTQVINKFLQSEVDHVKDDPRANALNEENYKFTYKGRQELNGHLTYIYQLKPKAKRTGLFKGRMYLDVYTGGLRRVEGRVSKSPSFFIRSIDFVQDYEEIDGYTLPSQLHSTTRARVIGRAVVSIIHKTYVLKPRTTQESSSNQVASVPVPGSR